MLANTLTQVWSCKICTLLSSRFGSLWQLLYTVYTVCWLNSPKTHTLKICLCKFSGFLLYFILDYQTSTTIEVSVYFRKPLRNSFILMPLKIFARNGKYQDFQVARSSSQNISIFLRKSSTSIPLVNRKINTNFHSFISLPDAILFKESTLKFFV